MNDFALVILPENRPINAIDPVQLNRDPNVPANGDDLDVFGWGDTDPDPNVAGSTDVPLTVTVDHILNDQCAALYSGTYVITPGMLCAIKTVRKKCDFANFTMGM